MAKGSRTDALGDRVRYRMHQLTRRSLLFSSAAAIATAFVAALPGRTALAATGRKAVPASSATCHCPFLTACGGGFYTCPPPCCCKGASRPQGACTCSFVPTSNPGCTAVTANHCGKNTTCVIKTFQYCKFAGGGGVLIGCPQVQVHTSAPYYTCKCPG